MNKKTESLFNKVADITIFFWIIKIVSTTVGEASADFFSHLFGVKAIIITFVLLIGSVFVQIRFKRYVPWMYWTVIVLVAVFGTMFSDSVHHLGVSLIVSTIAFIVLLLVTFKIWHLSEKTLDPHHVHTTLREIFYWIVIFFTFALGTAAGDLVAGTFHFGLLDATLIFGVIMVIAPIVLYFLKLNKVALFWTSYILTRPFGAAGADLLGKPVSRGGFGLGDGTTALLSLLVVIALVVWLSIKHKRAMLAEERSGQL